MGSWSEGSHWILWGWEYCTSVVCSNHNGHAPTIILIPRTLTSHTHAYILYMRRHSSAHAQKKQPGNHFHIYFLCIHTPLPFICFHKNNAKPLKAGFNKWFLEIPFEGPRSKCGGRLYHVRYYTGGCCQKLNETQDSTNLVWLWFHPSKRLILIHSMYKWLNLLDPSISTKSILNPSTVTNHHLKNSQARL